ncbi:mitochondrial ribosomal protein L37-domain-containing protein, partial [Flammula alnicola]
KMSFLQALRRQPAAASIRLRGICRSYATDTAAEEKPKASKDDKKSAAPRSSCAPETILKGVNYLKGQAPVAALADDAYPEWLWKVLQPRVFEDDGPGGKKERVERRKINQQAIKDRNFMQTQ